jgi:hypothetical protein
MTAELIFPLWRRFCNSPLQVGDSMIEQLCDPFRAWETAYADSYSLKLGNPSEKDVDMRGSPARDGLGDG